MDTAIPVLVAQDIHKRFGNNEVLKGISMTAELSRVISILGSSGSGKSTFLRCLNLLEVPDSGTLSVDGEEILIRNNAKGSPVPANRKQLPQ